MSAWWFATWSRMAGCNRLSSRMVRMARLMLSGRHHSTRVRPTTEPIVLDVELPAGACFDVPLPPGHNAFVYVHEGAIDVGDTRIDTERMAILANDDEADGVRFAVAADGQQAARVLLVAGRPLHEPIAQYGPFVMNSTAELQRAVEDFQRGVFAR
jgi:redox-sensitive bicupin YhaK (pirin superfamily)